MAIALFDFLSQRNAAITIIFSILCFLLLLKWRIVGRKKKFHPIGGTMMNQLLHFSRLHHYMTDLARRYKTYRLIAPFQNEIYTADPANVEYILKSNFQNYGKMEKTVEINENSGFLEDLAMLRDSSGGETGVGEE